MCNLAKNTNACISIDIIYTTVLRAKVSARCTLNFLKNFHRCYKVNLRFRYPVLESSLHQNLNSAFKKRIAQLIYSTFLNLISVILGISSLLCNYSNIISIQVYILMQTPTNLDPPKHFRHHTFIFAISS